MASMRWWRRLFRLTLRLYSREFRARHGADMEASFSDMLRRASVQKSGVASELRAATAAVLDVLKTAPAERRAARATRPSPHRPAVLHVLMVDAAHAWRRAWRSPFVSVCVILTAMLGIGVVTAVATVLGSVLIKPLPLPGADRLVRVSAVIPEAGTVGAANPLDLEDWRAESRAFDVLAAYDEVGGGSLRIGDGVQWIRIASVDAQLMRALGIRAAVGRNFVADELAASACAGTGRVCPGRVVILSDRLWREGFGADPGVLGRTVVLDGEPREVVGVLPPLPRSVPGGSADLWQPLVPRPGTFWMMRGAVWQGVIGRLREHVTVATAREDLGRISARLGLEYPRTNGNRRVAVEPLVETMVAGVRPVLLLLAASVTTVLLIACVNIGTLLLAGAERRVGEYAILAALGGTQLRLGRQALLEAGLLATLGGMLGVFFASACVKLLLALYPGELPRADEIHLNARVLLGVIALVVFAACASAIPLLRRIRRVELARDLRGAARNTASLEQRFAADLMVGVQVALSVALLFGAALLARAYRSVSAVDLGFRSAGVVAFRLAPSPDRYHDAERRAVYFAAVLRSLRAIPGVQSAAASMFLPLTSAGNAWEDRPRREGVDATFDTAPLARIDHVTPGYFETMNIPLRGGITVGAAAEESGFRGVWVNEAYAQRAFGTLDVVGRRVVWENDEAWEIAGVVGDAKFAIDLWMPAPPTVYFPIGRSSFLQERWIVVRAGSASAGLTARVHDALARIDPSVAAADMMSMTERETRARAPERFRALLLAVLSTVALLLAMLGVYSSLAVAVGRRTREIGLRLALGETRRAVLLRVLRRATVVTVSGTALGGLTGLAGKRWLESFLAGMSGGSAPLFGAVSALLLTLAAAAALLPAARASRVDPATTLRGDS